MNQGDLKRGMYLVNDGPGPIPVYLSGNATGKVGLVVMPKELIGQIVNFTNGPNGYVVRFQSEAIYRAGSFFEEAFSWLTNGAMVVSGSVNFSDLQKNVTDKQVSAQLSAINAAEAKGASFENAVKDLAHSASNIIGDVIPWNLVWVAGGFYVVTHWKNFFSQTKLRK